MGHYGVLICIIAGMGILGGLISFSQNYDKATATILFFKCVSLSLGAAILVPLFLEMISSDLITKSETNSYYYLVFAGFCLVAALYSKRFIETLGEKILREVEAVKQKANANEETLETIVASDAEDGDSDEQEFDTDTMERKLSAQKLNVDPESLRKVLLELGNERYRFRSSSGISAKSNVNRDLTNVVMQELEKRKLVRKLHDGKYWSLTASGRHALKGYRKPK